jgi:glutaminase
VRANTESTRLTTTSPIKLTPPNGPLDRHLKEVYDKFHKVSDGQVANYIPELAKVDPAQFGVALTTMDGFRYSTGAYEEHFTIQSVSKPFVYALALADCGFEEVIRRVGVEPTGDSFNSIMLEPVTGRPLNPMVNSGAILTASLVNGRDGRSRFERIRAGLSAFAGRELEVDERVFQSEQETGYRNLAVANLMRSTGALEGDVNEICSTYFRQCSVLVSCADLSVMAATLARGGVNPLTRRRVLSEDHVEKVLSVMSTCGMYDSAGQWMLRVGLPAKSGVAGGICAVLPGQLGIGTFSPPLDSVGNSVRGELACRELSRRFSLHMLRPPGLPAHPVRSTYRGDVVTSKRIRPPRDRELLRRLGSSIVVHELQGDLAFATAERMVRTVREHLTGAVWVVLDLRRVGAIEPSAVALLRVLLDELAERRMTTLLADPHRIPAVVELERDDLSTQRVRDFESALEWAEEALLMRENVRTLPPTVRVPFGSQELLSELRREEVDYLRAATETRTYEPREVIFEEGDPADAVYFVTRGLVNVEVGAGRGKRRLRLNTVPAGHAFGELALVDGGERSLRIVVVEATECKVLSVEAFEKMRKTYPAACDAIFRAIARSLSARLRQSTREIQILEG